MNNTQYNCQPVGLFHEYLIYHLQEMRSYNQELLSETLLFGLGCGLSFNFDQFKTGAIRMDFHNEAMAKDLMAHLNIKTWCKTEPNSDKFIEYINRLLIQNQPVITLRRSKAENLINVRTILINNYNSKTQLYSIQESVTGNINYISEDQLKTICNFKSLNIALNNFWFEIALPEKLFSIEKSVEWALLKNVQTMLYMPGNNTGISGLKSFGTFLHQLPNNFNKQQIIEHIAYFRKAMDGTCGSHNRELFIQFLNKTQEILQINSLSQAVEKFNNSSELWNQLINDFNSIEKEKSSNFKFASEPSFQKIEKIIELEESALRQIETSIFSSKTAIENHRQPSSI